MPTKHQFVNPKADDTDPTITRASDWNADHEEKYAPGSFTINTGEYTIFVEKMELGAGEIATVEGTGQIRII